MGSTTVKVIGVIGEKPPEGVTRLFEALATRFGFRFELRHEGDLHGLDAVVLTDSDRKTASRLIEAGLSCYAKVSDKTVPSGCQHLNVEFSSNAEVPDPFSGLVFHCAGNTEGVVLEPSDRELIVAEVGDHPVWSQWTDSGIRSVYVSMGIPDLASGECVSQYLNKSGFIQLLPLVDFVRFVTEDREWEYPPARACFMFDDPNLHWSSFGNIGYPALIASARSHSYHVSFATIPLDTWFAHEPTAELFRTSRDYVSFLVHGNNHTKRELAQSRNETDCLRLGGQSLRRIDRFEQRTNLEVSRVMAAPHGACNYEMAAALLKLDFEAACISRGSMMSCNSGREWSPSVGLNLSEFLGGGLPLINRFSLNQDCRIDIALASYLGQPIIPVGHHQDVREGYKVLEDLSDFINGLGQAQWLDMRQIARSNYLARTRGEVMRVRTYSRRFRIDVPDGINRIEIECAWPQEDASPETVTIERPGKVETSEVRGSDVEFFVDAPGPIDVNIRHLEWVDFRSVPAPQMAIWPLVRRILAEGRDRVTSKLGRSN